MTLLLIQSARLVVLAVCLLLVAVGGVGRAAAAEAVSVVAAESSYGSVVKLIGGDNVAVTSLLDSPDVDPHRFQASPKIGKQLTRADLVVMNGLGFDAWMGPLLQATSAPHRRVIKASVAASAMVLPNDNPHLFYSPQAMLATASRVARVLAEIDPDHKGDYRSGLVAFREQLLPVYDEIQKLIALRPNLTVTATVPVYNYMLDLVGYRVLYREIQFASMRGSRPSAKQTKQFIQGLKQHRVALLIDNLQVQNRLTTNVVQTAKANGIPVVGVSAIPLHGENYAQWQVQQLRAINKALDKTNEGS